MGIRKGPAGKGKLYTQIHGDTKYNRQKMNEDTKKLIGESNDIPQPFSLMRGLCRCSQTSLLWEKIKSIDDIIGSIREDMHALKDQEHTVTDKKTQRDLLDTLKKFEKIVDEYRIHFLMSTYQRGDIILKREGKPITEIQARINYEDRDLTIHCRYCDTQIPSIFGYKEN